ncbi:MAG TPA: putative protein N(5)-glutamine methyltransferase [Mycobacteriales bacterium]|nr:putative protein N(5)-glutamine methyltransferase [Mycobacteriales bacterium]
MHRRDALVAVLREAGCVFAEQEAELLTAGAPTRAELDRLVARRVAGEPLEQVLGWAEFCGLRVAVEPGVFVPRRRTGLLVAQALARAPARPVVVDLCCGSGAVGAALTAGLPGIELHAVDVLPAAVRCARRNLPGAAVYEGDLYSPLPGRLRGRVDLVTANAPYVPSGELAQLPREARLYEPRETLDGGADGLDVQRRVAAGALDWLAPAGCVLLETGARQADLSAELLAGLALVVDVVTSDEPAATVVVGRRP